MKKVSSSQVVTAREASELPLPPEIQEALGELVGAARDGLLALSVGLGLRVVHELMEAEVTEVVGPKGKHDRDRTVLHQLPGIQKGQLVQAEQQLTPRVTLAASVSSCAPPGGSGIMPSIRSNASRSCAVNLSAAAACSARARSR